MGFIPTTPCQPYLDFAFLQKPCYGRALNQKGFSRHMANTSADQIGRAQDQSWFGHPRGLAVLFLTEMWERFSYYGMRALLIFYLTQHFLFSDRQSYAIYGAYTALVYLTPVLGGMLADRYLGSRKAVTLGAILLVLGHFGMALEGPAAVATVGEDGTTTVTRHAFFTQIFYFSLALIVCGVGFLKANISTIVGDLYEIGDPRRDAGFTIFYMGINIGAFSAALLCGWLGQTYGWAYGFGLAGIGMLAGLVIFLRGQRHLAGLADPPNPTALRQPSPIGLSVENTIYVGTAIGLLVVWYFVQNQEIVGSLLGLFGAGILAIILFYAIARCEPIERDRLLVLTLLTLFSVLFWALFEQAGSSLNIFTDRSVDRTILGTEVPASTFQSLNALFIFLLAPLFSLTWLWLAQRRLEPNIPVKFALALALVGLGFLVLAFGAGWSAATGTKTGVIWIVVLYLLHTCGELCISPIGLSAVTKLSVPKIVGMMMGVWFLASAGANYIAGQIASLTSVVTTDATDAAANTLHVITVYSNVGWLAIAVAVALLALSPFLRHRMHGVT